jgi:hypothetical protein
MPQVFAYLPQGLSRIHTLLFLPSRRQAKPLGAFAPERPHTLDEPHRFILERENSHVAAEPAVDYIVRLQHGQIVRQPAHQSLHAGVQGIDSLRYSALEFFPRLVVLPFPRTANLVQFLNNYVESPPDVLSPELELCLWI